MKHKHADLIKAWADGAVIQFEVEVNGEWKDCPDNKPNWTETTRYRIKPSPKEVTIYYYEYDDGSHRATDYNDYNSCAMVIYKKTITLTEDDKIKIHQALSLP